MDTVHLELRETEYTSEEQVDTDLQMYESDDFLRFPPDSTATPPGAIGSLSWGLSSSLDVPTAGGWDNTGGLALNVSQSAPAQDYGTVTGVSPTFLQMPGMPQLEVPTAGGWDNTGGLALNVSQLAPLAQGYGTVTAPALQDNSNIASPNINGFILDYPTPGAPQDGHHFLTPSQPELPTGSSQSNSTTSPATATLRDPKQCPGCPENFKRWQDCDRHLLTHLPHWIHCPVPDCSWRGNRVKSFEQHWGRQDHLQYHESYGGIPGPELFGIFNPQEFVNQIKAGTTSTSDAASDALNLVRSKANQLQKFSMSDNLWGYKLKRAPQ